MIKFEPGFLEILMGFYDNKDEVSVPRLTLSIDMLKWLFKEIKDRL